MGDDDGIGDVGLGVEAKEGLWGVDKGGLVRWLGGELDTVARGGAEKVDGHEAQTVGDFGQGRGRWCAISAGAGDGQLAVLKVPRE